MSRNMVDSGVEWIGKIPEGWCVTKIKYVVSQPLQYGASESGIEYQTSLPRYIRITDISAENTLRDDGKLSLEYVVAKPYLLQDEDILFARSGATVGKTFFYKEKFGEAAFAGYLIRASFNKKIIVPRFAFYNTLGANYESWKLNAFTQATIQNIGADRYNNYTFALPSYVEQQRIASFLDRKCSAIDDVLAKTQESIEEYKKLKQAVITEAVTKGIRGKRPMKDSGIDWIGQIPKDWNIVALRYIGQCQNGISKGAEFFGIGYPFISYSDVYKNIELPNSVTGLIQSTEEERERYSVQRGDIFFTRTSETIEEIGFTSVCTSDIPNASFAGFLIRVRPFDDTLNPDYAKYYFRSDIHRRYFVKEMIIVIRASLGQELLKKLPVLLPSKEEQQEIADYLDKKCAAIDTLISKKQQFIEELTAYKKSLIYEYVTGKKEVPA